MPLTEIKDWSFLEFDCEFCSEGIQLQLAGYSVKDRRFMDGQYIITSRVISSQGRSIITENGSHYLLKGDPASWWKEDQKLLDHSFDSGDPLSNFFFNNCAHHVNKAK